MFGSNSVTDNNKETSSMHSVTGTDRAQDVSAFVGEGVEFKGIINYQGTIRIDGKLEGEIHTDGILIVGEGALIEAKVEAGTVICRGRIVGEIRAREKIQVMAPGILNGSVKTPSLSMEEGVLFTGTCEMGLIESKESNYSRQEPIGTFDDSLKVV